MFDLKNSSALGATEMVVMVFTGHLVARCLTRQFHCSNQLFLEQSVEGAVDRGNAQLGYLLLGGLQDLEGRKGPPSRLECLTDGLPLAGIALHVSIVSQLLDKNEFSLSNRPMKWISLTVAWLGLGLALAQTPLPVVSTTEFLADLLRQVGGSRIKVSVLVPRSADPHSFDPRPSAVLAATRARLVVANGLGLEPFFETLEAQLPPTARVLELANDLPDLIATGDQHTEGDADHDHGAYDPHLWLDPVYGIRYVERIRDALIAMDATGQASYQQNAERYILQIRQADTRVRRCLREVPVARRKVVTQHQALAYFARTYQIKLAGSLANYAGQERGAQQLASLVRTMKQEGVKVILAEPQFNPAQVNALAESTGARVIRVYADAFDEKVNTYLGLLEANGLAVCAALK